MIWSCPPERKHDTAAWCYCELEIAAVVALPTKKHLSEQTQQEAPDKSQILWHGKVVEDVRQHYPDHCAVTQPNHPHLLALTAAQIRILELLGLSANVYTRLADN